MVASDLYQLPAGDLGQVVDLLGRDMGFVQLHRHLAVLPMSAATLPTWRVQRFQHRDVLAA
jgi:hypothetical protein